MEFRLVVLESPFKGNGDYERNIVYSRRCLADCLKRGEAPFASHLLYPQVLDDTDPLQREQGILAGFAWRPQAVATVVYTDYGISPGMQKGIDDATSISQPVEYRQIGK